MEVFQVHILAADQTFYEGPCVSMTIPTSDGVLVLVDSAERPEDIDAIRAQKEIDESREALLQKRSPFEHQVAQATLARAVNRLRVKNRDRME